MSSRPKLTPLSALMPQKGSAARPEQVIERARESARELSGKLASNQSDGLVESGSTFAANLAPITAESASERAGEQVSKLESEAAREDVSERPGFPTSEPASSRTNKQAGKLASQSLAKFKDLDDLAEYVDGPRSSVSFRMTDRLKDRLRDYAHFSRRQKQDIMDQAVHEFLRREGY